MNKGLMLDYKKCEMVIKKSSKTFYKAFSMLKDESRRNAVYAIYAYCRYADDIIDEANNFEGLIELYKELANFVTHNVANNYIFRALSDVRKKLYPSNFDFKPYFDMIEGQKMDFDFKEYKTLDELINYCTKVASSVGEMLVYVLTDSKEYKLLKEISFELGVAMQLTNILRDVGEDYDNKRVYLPTEILNQFNVDLDTIKNKQITEEFKNLFDYIANIAYQYYDKAKEKLYLFPKDSRIPLLIALKFYRGIIKACKDSEYDVLTKRNFVSKKDKIILLEEVKKEYE
ncbi:phytoene/squalene synthase family protein [Haploplasma axanthum]|uniref:Dehydrosqualene synthase n=1 Tax=Haploplasma axanthum TaxID=29552 RepID=A0A449BFK8_HAPAX|nr:phytoene/squalene synthase family protein [Haploplasma axanthum]VEU81239.1 Dehydrosqualene synthase [Haploplasma axanthum]